MIKCCLLLSANCNVVVSESMETTNGYYNFIKFLFTFRVYSWTPPNMVKSTHDLNYLKETFRVYVGNVLSCGREEIAEK